MSSTLGALPEKTLDAIHKYAGENDRLRRSLFWKGRRHLEYIDSRRSLSIQSSGSLKWWFPLKYNRVRFCIQSELGLHPLLVGIDT